MRRLLAMFLKAGYRGVRLALVGMRFLQIHSFVLVFGFYRRFSNRQWLFNLDCHISVIADLKVGLREFPDVKLVSWSISGHNFVFRKWFSFADPIMHIGSRTWIDLTPDRRNQFLRVYRRFLSNFDGFVVTFPPAFVELFEEFEKPILLVVAIRYEYPFSSDAVRWSEFTQTLIRLREAKSLTLVANNRGDAEYLEEFVGGIVPVVASVCDYIPIKEGLGGQRFPIFAKSLEVSDFVRERVGAPWTGEKQALGANYGWRQLLECSAVVYIPYNSSTMSLFEFATLGIPVLIPDEDLLKDLASKFDGVLSELTFLSMSGLQAPPGTPTFSGLQPENSGYLDWWLDRSDFFDADLMPNVIRFGSFDDPVFSQNFDNFRSELAELTPERNARLRSARRLLIHNFAQTL